MLTTFKVRNFRNFNDWFEFSFKSNKNYEFNSFAVENNNVKHGIIYGKNGCGKSNLGLAFLDLTSHLKDEITQLQTLADNYLNGDNPSDIADFIYEFIFDGSTVTYKYGKYDRSTIAYEELLINGVTIVSFDRRLNDNASFNLKGAETLKNDLSSNKKISALKYIRANAVLDLQDTNNLILEKFFTFIDGMVFFRTLKDKTESHGQQISIKRISEAIINSNKIAEFQKFLEEAEIKCKLKITGEEGDEVISFDFDRKTIEFSRVASTGTISLGIFYYWWMQIESNGITFAYIDEFDAYYHQSLSKAIVKLIIKSSPQTVLTTHNTSILTNDLLRPDCYFELSGNVQRPFYTLVDKELRKAHNLEKIYKGITTNE
jgi:AAA15 family ATPase/GTPase